MKFFNQKQLAMTLTFLGAAPMVLGGVCVLANINPANLPASSAVILHAYSVVIAGFVAGIHWGIHFCKRTEDSVYILSSLIAILLVISFWFAGQPPGFAMVIVGFILLWVEEYRFSKQRVTTEWFWRIRNIASAIAIFSLLMGIAGS